MTSFSSFHIWWTSWMKVIVFQNLHDSRGKRLVPVCVAEHDIAVFPALSDTGYIPFAVRDDIPLVGLFLYMDRGVIAFENIFLERIFRKVVVRGADVAVPKVFSGQKDGMRVVFYVVLWIDHYREAFVLVLKVEERFFFVSEHYYYIFDACLAKLLYLALYQDLALYCQKALWLFK